MADDEYGSFDELRNQEREGVDFRIWVMRRETSAAIVAPHGGMIEPGTSESAVAIAANDYGLYCFEGLRKRPHRDLHITSANFRQPKCVELVAGCDLVVVVHGLDCKGPQLAQVGGLDTNLRDAICKCPSSCRIFG
jgi:phage replication-related protein YjqB (UPF0714/DUF867 family)